MSYIRYSVIYQFRFQLYLFTVNFFTCAIDMGIQYSTVATDTILRIYTMPGTDKLQTPTSTQATSRKVRTPVI